MIAYSYSCLCLHFTSLFLTLCEAIRLNKANKLKQNTLFHIIVKYIRSRDNAVGIATRYGLGGPGSNPGGGGGEIFRTHPD